MNKYSQFGEEEHIWEILSQIGDGSKVVTDIGARLTYSNSARLIEERGYHGNLVDMNEGSCRELRAKLPTANVRCVEATISNINDLVPNDTHILSIDVDSRDWWLWANLIAKPALVILETNPCEGLQVAEYDCARKSKAGYGCSVEAAKALGTLKGYTYLGKTEANCFFTKMECSYRFDAIRHLGIPTGTENNVL